MAVEATAFEVFYIVAIGAGRPAILGALTALFTAVHTAAWNYTFPTPTEQLLWRVLTCGGILIGPWAFIETTPLAGGDWWRSGGKWWALGYVVYEMMWGVTALLYLVSRLYVMVECFIAFRSAPSSIYEQVNWNAYVPHFGA